MNERSFIYKSDRVCVSTTAACRARVPRGPVFNREDAMDAKDAKDAKGKMRSGSFPGRPCVRSRRGYGSASADSGQATPSEKDGLSGR